MWVIQSPHPEIPNKSTYLTRINDMGEAMFSILIDNAKKFPNAKDAKEFKRTTILIIVFRYHFKNKTNDNYSSGFRKSIA